MEAHKTKEALEHLESAARSAPQDPEVRYRLGRLYLDLGRKEDADREMTTFKELRKVQDELQKPFVESRTGN
jgi:Flp pilus assembly protein TadD